MAFLASCAEATWTEALGQLAGRIGYIFFPVMSKRKVKVIAPSQVRSNWMKSDHARCWIGGKIHPKDQMRNSNNQCCTACAPALLIP